MAHALLTQEKVKRLFSYDPETGLLTRLITISSRAQAGDVVGWDNGDGYLVVTIDYKVYRVHRIIWLWLYGEFPKNQIDHKNHIRSANWIKNLREATHQENQKNRTMQIGSFEDKDEAITARKIAEIKYGFHPNHGKNYQPCKRKSHE